MNKGLHSLAYLYRQRAAEGRDEKKEKGREEIMESGRRIAKLEDRLKRLRELLKMID